MIRPQPRSFHRPGQGAAQDHGGGQVQRQDVVPVGVGHPVDRRDDVDAGVVDEDVDRAEGRCASTASRSTAARSARSAASQAPRAVVPSRIAARPASSSSGCRAAITTSAPACGQRRAKACPRPLLPPVTRAVRPVRSNRSLGIVGSTPRVAFGRGDRTGGDAAADESPQSPRRPALAATSSPSIFAAAACSPLTRERPSVSFDRRGASRSPRVPPVEDEASAWARALPGSRGRGRRSGPGVARAGPRHASVAGAVRPTPARFAGSATVPTSERSRRMSTSRRISIIPAWKA